MFFMAEDAGLCTHFKYHKHKLVLFLSAMRQHAAQLKKDNDLDYWQLTLQNCELSYEEKLAATLAQHPNIDTLVTYTIEDHFFAERLEQFCEARKLKLIVVNSPGFMASKNNFGQYLQGVKKPLMHSFYIQQRKRFGLLVDAHQKPLHGQWSFDADNRKKLPKGIIIPRVKPIVLNEVTRQVIALVNHLFNDHPGSTDNFNWATNRAEALTCLDQFLKERFELFGPYEDAISQQQTFLFHSVLSPYINMGLLQPHEVVNAAVSYAQQQNTHYPSVEGFVRQIIGWREFMRGMYHHYPNELQQNHFNHTRHLKPCWYNGTTGIPPLDDSIKKANTNAYTHHIERLMVIGNIMLLCQVHPDHAYRWFMEMYIDSSDWVMVPNVYGMSQFADGGLFATKPYIAGSAYMLKMSNYSKKGDWPDIVNGLYWKFINDHYNTFAANPRMAMMAKTLDKMAAEKKERLFILASQFINRVTA